MSLVIKANIDNVDDLPNIPCDSNINNNIDNLIKTITNKTAKKKLIIGLLNKDLMKYNKNNYKNFPINRNQILQGSNPCYSIFNDIQVNIKELNDYFSPYPNNINFLHLVIYHHIDIDKLLDFLLNIFYKVSNEIIKKKYFDVINSATKFDFYNFDFTQDYEKLFLSDYEKLTKDNKEFNNIIIDDLIKQNILLNDSIKSLSKQVDVYKTIVNHLVERLDKIEENNDIIKQLKEIINKT